MHERLTYTGSHLQWVGGYLIQGDDKAAVAWIVRDLGESGTDKSSHPMPGTLAIIWSKPEMIEVSCCGGPVRQFKPLGLREPIAITYEPRRNYEPVQV